MIGNDSMNAGEELGGGMDRGPVWAPDTKLPAPGPVLVTLVQVLGASSPGAGMS